MHDILYELGKVSNLTVFHFEIFLNVYKWSYKRSSWFSLEKKLHHCSFFVHVSVFHDAHTMQPVPSVKVNARKDS